MPSFPLVSRSWCAWAQACTCTAKRNQVSGPSLTSRDGPRFTTPGMAAAVDVLGAVSGACGFPSCSPVGGAPAVPVCADAAAAANIATNDADHDVLLALQRLLMDSSSAVGLQARKIPFRTWGGPMFHIGQSFATPLRQRFRRAKRLACPLPPGACFARWRGIERKLRGRSLHARRARRH